MGRLPYYDSTITVFGLRHPWIFSTFLLFFQRILMQNIEVVVDKFLIASVLRRLLLIVLYDGVPLSGLDQRDVVLVFDSCDFLHDLHSFG